LLTHSVKSSQSAAAAGGGFRLVASDKEGHHTYSGRSSLWGLCLGCPP